MGSEGPFTTMEVRLMKQVSGFGFRIIGGEEEGSQVCYFCHFDSHSTLTIKFSKEYCVTAYLCDP